MKVLEPSEEPARENVDALEKRLLGRAVSRGVAIGRVICLHGNSRQYFRTELQPDDVDQELARLRTAIDLAKRQLTKIASEGSDRTPSSRRGIFDAHRMLVEDPLLLAKFENEIAEQKVSAEWAIKLVTDEYLARYKLAADGNLRDLSIDLEDVSDRLLAALGPEPGAAKPIPKDTVLAAAELKPSTLADTAVHGIAAAITENGGWTSHAFILAREMNLPAVTGIKDLLSRVRTRDLIIVDGFNGVVIVNPTEQTLTEYGADSIGRGGERTRKAKRSDGLIKTLDGRTIRIYANSENPEAYKRAKSGGAYGVGLYRSEILFSQTAGFPSEDDQYEAYRAMADVAVSDAVNVRTFDLNADFALEKSVGREANPALGMRAIRLGLTHRKILKPQLRAVLRASFRRHVEIVVPMVSGVAEVRTVRQALRREKSLLAGQGIDVGDPKLGIMIEVPSAVMMVDELASECDFLCLGTNDLIQYMLAVDRDNASVAKWFRALHPAVLRAIQTVLQSARNADKRVIICGEMAGSPYFVPLLIGLGATDLSMNVQSIAQIVRTVSGIAHEEAARLATSVANCVTAEEVERILNNIIRKYWSHLFPADFAVR